METDWAFLLLSEPVVFSGELFSFKQPRAFKMQGPRKS